MKNKKGFTLIELLAVIAVLGIILVIAIPIANNMIHESRIKTFKLSAESIINVAKEDYQNKNMGSLSSESIIYTFIDGNVSPKLSLNGELPKSGTVEIDVNGNSQISVQNDEFCAVKRFEDENIKIYESGNEECLLYTLVTLTVNLDGGTTEQIFEEKYKEGAKIALIPPTKDGYIFNGWEVIGTGSSLVDGVLTIGIGSTVLTAYWLPYVDLTVELNGGTIEENPAGKYVAKTRITLEEPMKVGYVFGGWEVTGTGSSIVDNVLTVGIEDTVLTANWLAYVNLTVELNGGTIGNDPTGSYTEGSSITIEAPTKEGYMFDGWTVEGTGSSLAGNILTMGNEDLKITANYTRLFNPVTSYSCTNGSVGSEPYDITYTGTCEVIDDGNGVWRIRFLTSGTMTTKENLVVDLFLVGGGSGSASSGAGGSGGYTKTYLTKEFDIGSYEVRVGAGGAVGASGGISYFGDSATYFANGGTLTAGGSGGGAASSCPSRCNGGGKAAGSGASDGNSTSYATGQGSTTREFGETNGTMYSGGGGGKSCRVSAGTVCWEYNSSGYCRNEESYSGCSGAAGSGGTPSGATANTGGGGHQGSAGGSGIVIIRNAAVGTPIIINDEEIGTFSGNVTVEEDGEDWKIKFLSSGTLSLKKDLEVDMFLVGGGAGANTNGGSGGYTKTYIDQEILSGYHTIVVGSGGAAGGVAGGTSYFGVEATYYAAGGTVEAGGSGGGKSASCPSYCNSGEGTNAGAGGSDGNNGTYGTGQGSTTREFGEDDGTLYSGGGGGSSCRLSAGQWCGSGAHDDYCFNYSGCSGAAGAGGTPSGATANTGGGGHQGGSGGSGIVIIRNAKKKALIVNLNGGSTTQIFEEKYPIFTTITLTEPTKAGYTFIGWTVEGASITDNVLTLGSEDTTITANWEIYPKLTVELAGGNTTQTFGDRYAPGSQITLTEPTKEGYVFFGWTVEGTGSSLVGNVLTIGSEDTTITANWGSYYVLTVNLNEGSTTQTFENKYLEGTELTLIEPTKEGYAFIGWTIEGTGSSLVDNVLTMGTSDTTITANWGSYYVLTVNLDGGSISSNPAGSHYEGEKITLTSPTRSGYTFKGWSVSGEGASISGNTLTMGTADTTITATWSKNTTTTTTTKKTTTAKKYTCYCDGSSVGTVVSCSNCGCPSGMTRSCS